MAFTGFVVAALLLVSAVGDAGVWQLFRKDRWSAGYHWAAQSLAIKVVAALLLVYVARGRW